MEKGATYRFVAQVDDLAVELDAEAVDCGDVPARHALHVELRLRIRADPLLRHDPARISDPGTESRENGVFAGFSSGNRVLRDECRAGRAGLPLLERG